jgi:hypothetical protein
MTSPVDMVLARLDRVTRTGSGWSARCPAHADRLASLSVAEGAAGKALVYCHAGCGIAEVTAAVGLRVADLFVARRKRRTRHG